MTAILFWAVLGTALVGLIASQRRRRGYAIGAAALLAAGTLAAHVAWQGRDDRQSQARADLAAGLPRLRRSDGYVSSDSCRSCHPAQHASWHRTYHRTMTTVASPETVKGDFDGVVLESDGVRYRLERRGDEFWARRADGGEQRIDMITGSHHMQAYWTRSGRGNEQREFPFTFLLDERKWVGRQDVFLLGPELRRDAAIWNRVCIECHATAGQPRVDAETGVPDSRVGELGIACESCHGPSAKHVAANLNPLRRFAHHLGDHADSTIVNPARLPAARSAEVCGQCHAIACQTPGWNRHGLSFHPGDDLDRVKPVARKATLASSPCGAQLARREVYDTKFWSDGMVRVSGREYNGLVDSACFRGGSLSCLSCHSMHDSEPEDQLKESAKGDGACLACHARYTQDVAGHTHHAAGTAGSACMNCHMPYTTYGLLKAIRSHLIDSPSAAKTLATGRPNACNLCHLDKTLAWTAAHLQKWYGMPPLAEDTEPPVAAAVKDALSGDAGQRALVAWSMGWPPAQRASGTGWMAPFLANLLDDPYAAVRCVAYRSLRTVPDFDDFSFDYVAPASERRQARERALALWTNQKSPDLRPRPELLLDETGALTADFDRLLRQRDDHGMFLDE